MRKYIFRLSLLFLLSSIFFSCFFDNKIEISGNINKQDSFDLTDAYLILVPINQLKIQFSIVEGQMVAIEYAPLFPKKDMRKTGSFKYQLEKLPAGLYVIGINRLLPKYQPEYYPMQTHPEKYVSRALYNEKNQPIIIYIKNEILPPFKITLGDVILPFLNKQTFCDEQFSKKEISHTF